MINVVGIVGGGIMGAGIAEVTARSGCEVVLREVNEAAVEGAQARLTASLDNSPPWAKWSGQMRCSPATRPPYRS